MQFFKLTKLQCSQLLVFVMILGTVAPAMVEAVDSVSITNSVHSSQNTGGVSGADGTDGADGEDGQPGRDGKSGQSVSTVSGTGEASVHVETTVGGEVITNITKSTTGTDSKAEVSNSVEMSASADLGPVNTSSSVDEGAAEETKLTQIITTLQTLISHYVSLLF